MKLPGWLIGIGLPAAMALISRRVVGAPLADVSITSSFGPRVNPVTGAPQFHNGVDLAARVGTDVLSPFAGVAGSAYTNDAGGLQLTVQGDRYRAGFAHLSEVLTVPGQRVKRGQVIARTGQSGLVTGPHLHYTLKEGDTYVDPAPTFL